MRLQLPCTEPHILILFIILSVFVTKGPFDSTAVDLNISPRKLLDCSSHCRQRRNLLSLSRGCVVAARLAIHRVFLDRAAEGSIFLQEVRSMPPIKLTQLHLCQHFRSKSIQSQIVHNLFQSIFGKNEQPNKQKRMVFGELYLFN